MNTHEWLKERGYKGPVKETLKDHAVYFYRRVPGTNHQWVVREYKADFPSGPRYHGFEVEMTYETRGHVWVKSSFYGLTEADLKERLPDLEKRIFSAVEPMGGNPDDYQCGE